MEWFKRPSNIAITVFAVSLLIGVSVALVYAISTHQEPGLLEVCWGSGGQAHYVDTSQLEPEEEGVGDGSCERPEKLVWPAKQIPLSVEAISAEGKRLHSGADERESLDAAIVDINRQLGFELFALDAEPGKRPSITARVGAPVEIDDRKTRPDGTRAKRVRRHLGTALHRRDISGHIHCDMVVYSHAGHLRAGYLVSHHELLHCVGLSHSSNPSSVMYPFTYDDMMWDRMVAARVTDFDRDELRILYRKKSH